MSSTVQELKDQGGKHFAAGDWQQAADSYTAALELDGKDNVDAGEYDATSRLAHVLLSNRSAAYAQLSKYDEALADADRVVELHPKWAKGHNRRALALSKLDKKSEAALAKKLEGNVHFAAGDFAAAIKAFNEGVALDATMHVLYSNRSACFTSLRRFDAAIKDARECIKLAPTFIKGHSRLAQALFKQGKLDDAVTAVDVGLAVEGGADNVMLNDLKQAIATRRIELPKMQAAVFGDTLVTADGKKVPTATALAQAKKICVYSSAHWCPPCRRFSPMLVQLYEQLRGDGLEVVFLSGDKSEPEMIEYMKEVGMKWHAFPFQSREGAVFSQRHGINGIPALTILNPDGSLITKDGVQLVSQYGAGFMQRI